MPQLENIEAIEKRLWNAADTLRANSNYASDYLAVKDQIEAGLPVGLHSEDKVVVGTEEVFQHVYRVYPILPSPYCN